MIYIIGILILVTVVYVCSIVWIAIGFNSSRKRVPQPKKDSNSINKISVIIPVRNEEKNILLCLESFKKQDYNTENVEVIIVNDHSTDKTQELITGFISTNNLNINLLSLTDKTSKKEALKWGIEKSNYSIIATTDADCVLHENWLKNISMQFDHEVDMLLGPVIFKQNNGVFANFQTLDMMAIQGLEFGALHFNKPILNNAANLSYLKKSFQDVGGFDVFDTPSGDDVFLLEKFKSNHKKIKGQLTNDFIVETELESTFSGFLNQRLRWSSKAKYYSDPLLIFFSSIVLFQNISMIFIYLGIPLVEKYSQILIILLICKWLIDFILLFLVASFFERRRTLFYFIPVQLVYPIYIVVIWIVSITMKFEWKGRKF